MKPGPDAPKEARARPQGRRVQLFIAAHLLAVGAIYALALFVGGGVVGPPMPPAAVATAAPPAVRAAQAPVAAVQTPRTFAPTPLPDWAQRAEIAPPWVAR